MKVIPPTQNIAVVVLSVKILLLSLSIAQLVHISLSLCVCVHVKSSNVHLSSIFHFPIRNFPAEKLFEPLVLYRSTQHNKYR